MGHLEQHAGRRRLGLSATLKRAVAVAVLVAVAAASAGTADAKPVPPWDIAEGSGVARSTGPQFTFAFNARSGTAGENALGTMTYADALNVTISADVDCLEVTGNRALVRGIVTDSPIQAPGAGAVGQTMSFVVEDSGEGGGPDLLTPGFGGGGPCTIATWIPQPELSPIVSGEIVVQDCAAPSRNGKRCANRP